MIFCHAPHLRRIAPLMRVAPFIASHLSRCPHHVALVASPLRHVLRRVAPSPRVALALSRRPRLIALVARRCSHLLRLYYLFPFSFADPSLLPHLHDLSCPPLRLASPLLRRTFATRRPCRLTLPPLQVLPSPCRLAPPSPHLCHASRCPTSRVASPVASRDAAATWCVFSSFSFPFSFPLLMSLSCHCARLFVTRRPRRVALPSLCCPSSSRPISAWYVASASSSALCALFFLIFPFFFLCLVTTLLLSQVHTLPPACSVNVFTDLG